jgi:hypothetical protein
VSGKRRWIEHNCVRGGATSARYLSILLLAFGLLAAPPPAHPAAAASDAPVAVIGDETISGDDYLAYLRGYVRSKLYHGGSPDRLRELADEALDSLITDRLLAQEANRRGIEGDSSRVAERIAEIREAYSNRENWPEIEAQLPKIGNSILIDTQIDALKDLISEVDLPSEASLRTYYRERSELFTQPAAWDLSLILFGLPPSSTNSEWTATEAKASAAYEEIQAGRAFADVAAEHSTHESANAGGNLGEIHSGQLPEPAQTAVERLALGEVSAPVRLLQGYVILRLNGRKDAQLRPFDAVRARAEQLYRREHAESQWVEFVAALRDRTPVEVFDVSAQVQRLLAGE